MTSNNFVIEKDVQKSIIGFILLHKGYDLENMISYFQKEIKWIQNGKYIKPDDRGVAAVSGGQYVSYPIEAGGRRYSNFSNRLMKIYFKQENKIFSIYHFEVSQ